MEQGAGIGVFQHPRRTIRALFHIADAVAHIPALRGFGAAMAVKDDAVERPGQFQRGYVPTCTARYSYGTALGSLRRTDSRFGFDRRSAGGRYAYRLSVARIRRRRRHFPGCGATRDNSTGHGRSQFEARNRDRQLKTLWASTPWAQVHDAIPFSLARLMVVSTDNHVELRRGRVKIQLPCREGPISRPNPCRRRPSTAEGRPNALIDVPSNGDHWRQSA
jgi:hypothetical protein